ncbi:hypothetical protein TrST_g13468 [Triparma strigata]|uniref:Uncharacterized protein n=1 Tax=Triparma strigata TaxID=1606541 RepID=A0A9W7F2T3_9STRA|nr:hypothetical protein TrST_g13468 [Triparma strigata]
MPRRKSFSKQTKAADGTRRRMKSRNDRRVVAVIESVLSEPESDEDDSSDSDDSYDGADSESTPRTFNCKFAWLSCFSPLVHYMPLGASSSTSTASTASAIGNRGLLKASRYAMDYSGSIKTHPDLKKVIKDHKEALKRDANVLLDLSEGAEKVLAAREAVEANKQKRPS